MECAYQHFGEPIITLLVYVVERSPTFATSPAEVHTASTIVDINFANKHGVHTKSA